MPCFPSWMLQSITHLYLTASVLMDVSTLSCILFPSSIEPLPSPSPPLRAPLLLSVIIISISLTISLSPSVPSYEIKHESIIHSFKHIYHRRVCCTVPRLSAKLFFFSYCASVIHHSYGPIWKHHNAWECFLAVQALTRVVREAVKIPSGDSPVITIAVPA